jgi:exosortase
MLGTIQSAHARRATAWLVLTLLVAAGWVYWPSIEQVVRRWSQDPQYTHGYVVPLFAVLVLWFRRDSFPTSSVHPSWLGLPLVVIACVTRFAGSLYTYEWLEAGSLVPALAGMLLLTVGPTVLRWNWPAFAFLLLILPWPWQLDVMLTSPLRRIATVSSTYALQTLGLPALSRGNIIVVNELEVGVVEACSGLGMLMTFFALSAAVAFVIQRRPGQRIFIFLSAVPIGVLMNIGRITVTVVLHRLVSPELAKVVFHDVAGWAMMPMALFVMWLELLFLDRLWVPVQKQESGVRSQESGVRSQESAVRETASPCCPLFPDSRPLDPRTPDPLTP